MDLHALWFILITVLFIGFFILEGFDYGVGILLPFLGKNDNERKAIITSIGPFWDGNEVWLLTAGGAIFAAFPNWYATMFSGFYIALVLMLLALIVRGVAFEFRNKVEDQRWRTVWDWAIFFGSAIPALLWGVALTNIIAGVPIDKKMEFVGAFWDLLNPFALLGGLVSLTAFTLHGSLFLNLRLNEDLAERARLLAKRVWGPTMIVVALYIAIGYMATDIFGRLGVNPGLMPIAAGGTLLSVGHFIWNKQAGWGFSMMAVSIALSTISVFQGLFPRVMVSNINSDYSLTIYNASSSDYTLGVMTVVALTMVPIVLAYQAWTYYIFRQRVSHKEAH